MSTPLSPRAPRESICLKRGDAALRSAVQLELVPFGRDWLLLLSGGEAHLGSVCASEGGVLRQWTWEGHREGELARELAELLEPLLPGELLVVAGIHYDQATGAEIATLVAHVRAMATELAARLADKGIDLSAAERGDAH